MLPLAKGCRTAISTLCSSCSSKHEVEELHRERSERRAIFAKRCFFIRVNSKRGVVWRGSKNQVAPFLDLSAKISSSRRDEPKNVSTSFQLADFACSQCHTVRPDTLTVDSAWCGVRLPAVGRVVAYSRGEIL